jgi:hypothetical protein
MNPLNQMVYRNSAALLAVATLLCGTLGMSNAYANEAFDTPEAAMNAFGKAVITNDDDELKKMLGANFHDLVPPVPADSRTKFLEAWSKSHAIKPDGDKRALVAVGSDGWTLPIPLVKSAQGWEFDTKIGAVEMRIRRIGRNELAVMQTLLAIRDAQLDYSSQDHDKDGLHTYAAKLASSPGKRDGLYWPTKAGEPLSPLGPAIADVEKGRRDAAGGYYGYRYKLLTSQGSHAAGGALNYMINGKLFGGFAVVAWPARYLESGVKTFMVNHDRQIYERDLGPGTSATASAMKSFDPGPGWEKVSP